MADRSHEIEDLARRLAEHEAPRSYTIVIPTHRTHPENEQDVIRFKNSVDDVRSKLAALNVGTLEIDELLRPVEGHIGNRSYWQHRDLGLAIFGAPQTEPVEISLPYGPSPVSHVGNRFLIRPLIPAFEEPDVPALVLSQGGASLFELTNDGARRVDVDLPGSVQDLNWFVDRESRLQQRPEPPTTHGSGFHGHSPREDEDEDLRRYLRAVGSVVNEALDDDSRPIVVAAPDDLRGRVEPHLGREVIAHAALNPQAPESEVADELQPVRTRLRAESRSELREHLAQSIGRGQAIVDLKESLVAGAQGRIDTLAVAIDTPAVWGVLDEEAQRVTIHETPADGDTDLLDRLAAVTLSRGGRVRSLEGPLDEGHGFVAIPRY